MKQRTQPFRSFVIRWERLKADLPNRRRLRKFVALAAAPRNEYLAPWVAVCHALRHRFTRSFSSSPSATRTSPASGRGTPSFRKKTSREVHRDEGQSLSRDRRPRRTLPSATSCRISAPGRRPTAGGALRRHRLYNLA